MRQQSAYEFLLMTANGNPAEAMAGWLKNTSSPSLRRITDELAAMDDRVLDWNAPPPIKITEVNPEDILAIIPDDFPVEDLRIEDPPPESTPGEFPESDEEPMTGAPVDPQSGYEPPPPGVLP